MHHLTSRSAGPVVPVETTEEAARLRTSTDDRVLFVASTGGHLAQLHRVARTLPRSPDSLWITFDHVQSRSLLRDENVRYVDYVPPRGSWRLLKASVQAFPVLRRGRFDLCVTTGAAVALAVLPLMRLRGVPCMYLESVSRTDGPSLTGRIVGRLRLAETFTQHAAWADDTWRRHDSVMASFATVPRPLEQVHDRAPSLFVTLGTIKPYRFDALVSAVLASGLAGDSTVWQLGETTGLQDLPGTVAQYISAAEFDTRCAEADVVITHSGVGTVLALLEMGVHPVVVPRRSRRREHVDDHQTQIAGLLHQAGVATVCEVDDLDADAVHRAAGLRTVTRTAAGDDEASEIDACTAPQ